MPEAEVLEARVDWITATYKTIEIGSRGLDLGAELLSEERGKGNYGRPTTFEGYHGTQTKHCFVGYRLDGFCVRLGGELARDRWIHVAGQASNVSRLDLAITVQLRPADDNVALAAWNRLPQRTGRAVRPSDYTLIQSRFGGQTLYCGKRASERFGRVYDKSRQSKGEYPDGCWRWEVEYKHDAAKSLADALAASRDQPGAIAHLVYKRFQEWGIDPPFRALPVDFSERPGLSRTDNETRFKWLTESVSRSVEKLSTSYSAEEIRRALGLQVVPNERLFPEVSLSEPRLVEISKRSKNERDVRLGGMRTDDRDRAEPAQPGASTDWTSASTGPDVDAHDSL